VGWQSWMAQNDPDIFPVLTGTLFIVCSQGGSGAMLCERRYRFSLKLEKENILETLGHVRQDHTKRSMSSQQE
jgi:hypothetical protein